MTSSDLLDTVPEFARRWEGLRTASPRAQVSEWERFYRRRWPDLLEKQQESYRSAGVSWRRVAETRVFPNLQTHWRRIGPTRAALRAVIPSVETQVRARLGFRGPVRHVLHVGIGCGAGWATTFRDTPAILYGLENAAELGWTGRPRLRSLVAHELAHVAQEYLRRQAHESGLDRLRGPYGQLYTEGFATRIEEIVRSAGGGRGGERETGWSAWCRSHRRELAQRFLRTTRRHRSVRRFFGSWYRIGGHVETGYWLGAEVVRSLEASRTLREIATLPSSEIRALLRGELQRIASEFPSAEKGLGVQT